MKILLHSITFLLLMVSATNVLAQRTASVSGNWNNTATWGGASVPTSTDAVTINGNVTVTVNVSNATCLSMAINPSNNNQTGTLAFTSGGVVAVLGNVTIGGSGNRAGSIDMSSGGTLQLTGAFTISNLNTFTAGTGTIEYNGSGAQTVTSGLGNYYNLTVSNGNTKTTAATQTVSNSLNVGANTTLNFNAGPLTVGDLQGSGTVAVTGTTARLLTVGGNNASTTFSGVISQTSTGVVTLTKNGTGTLTLSGTNTYAGLTTISAGALNIQNAQGTGTTAGGVTVASGAALELQGNITVGAEALTLNNAGISSGGSLRNISGNNTWGGTITLSTNAVRINSDAGTLTLNASNAITATAINLTVGGAGNTDISGTITTTSGTLTKDGNGTLTVSGTNTYTGATAVSAGVLNVRNAQGTGTTAGGVTVASGAALELQGNITVGAEALTLNNAGISSGGSLRNISGNNTWGGTITLSTNAVRINSDAGTLTLNASNAITATAINLTVGGAGNTDISGTITTTSGTLTKDGNGTLTVSGTNTYTGATVVSAGVLNVRNAQGTGTTAGGVTVSSGASLELQGGITVGAEALTISGTGPSGNAALDNVSGNNTWGGTITLAADATIRNQSGNFTINNASAVVTAGYLVTLGGNSTGGSISGVISGTGGVRKVTANGIWTLSGANTYSGVTLVNAGTLKAGVATNAFGSNSAVIMTNVSSAVLDINGFNNAIGSLTGGGTTGGNVVLGSATLTIGGDNTSPGAYAAVISGTSGTLTKIGSGTLTLTNANTYTGLTTVSAGTLQLNKTGGTTIPSTNSVEINGTGTLQISQDQSIANFTSTSGTGVLLVDASKTYTITGSYSATTGTINDQGTIKLNGGAVSFPGSGVTVNNGTANTLTNFEAASSATVTQTANISVAGNLTVSSGTLDMSTYTIDRASAGGTLTLSNGATLKIGSTNSIPANYSTHAIGSTSTIEYAGSNQSIATLNSSQSYGNIVLSGSGTKTLGGNISVATNWTRNSGPLFNANNNTVTFTGSSASAISAPSSGTRDANGAYGGETFHYLVLNKNAKATKLNLSSNLTVTKTLTLTTGTLELNSSDVLLPSNATSTADLASVNTTNADITYSSTGRFIIQRYVGNTSSVRTWRFLTAPLQASDPLTINDAWQEGQVNPDRTTPNATNPSPGFGTHITGPNSAYDAAKGFDHGLGNNGYSIEYFDNTGASTKLSYPANTKSTTLMSQLAWGIFIRGDRGFVIGDQYASSASTILEPKGKINIGDVTSTIVANRTNVVGNPYPCQINMAGVSIAGFTQQDFKLWDPKAFSNYSNTGKYIFFNWNGAGYDVNNGPTTTWAYPGTVESSEAFLTYNTVPGTSVVFHESDKVTGASTLNGIQSRPVAGNRPQGNPFAKLQVDLQFYDNPSHKFNYTSGANSYFNPAFNKNVIVGEDNISPVGSALAEIRILKDGYQLSTNREPIIDADDTVQLYLSNLNNGNHRVVVSSKYFVPSSSALLVDKYLVTETPIIIGNTDSTFYEFTVTGDVQSKRSDRFMVVLRPSTTLPVKFSNVKASKQIDAIAVQWKIENAVNAKSFEVERSADGVHFTKVNTQAVANTTNESYSWLDVAPNKTDNYYRIVLVDQSGAVTYSQVVVVKASSTSNSIKVFPTVVENNTMNIQFNNQAFGKYIVKLYSHAGQLVHRNEVNGQSNVWTEALSLPSSLQKGAYNVEIQTPSGKKIINKIILQ
ncbi:autotransporter-associated beta strand repeat-containing protein [Ferruginibacter sp. SUN002]|uniref:autotransporter-associated beta strand repeat-containing protein n=1 Tax=Ferruginibacter sp. SUN002 TaxID=2937789 RepID=UPI003D369F80